MHLLDAIETVMEAAAKRAEEEAATLSIFREKKSKTMVFHGHIETNRGCIVFQKSILRAFLDDFDVFSKIVPGIHFQVHSASKKSPELIAIDGLGQKCHI